MRILALILVFVNSGFLTAADQPNIVLIISDDHAWTDYGFMKHEHVKTPRIDKLASESVVFRRGYVPTALCRPSLMTLITGRYASVHGVTGNDPFGDGLNPQNSDLRESLISKIDKLETLPKLLGEQGYLSHQSGKWWEGNYSRGGFTHGMTRGYPQKGGRHGDTGLKIGREGIKEVEDFVDLAIEQDKPFFLWYAPFLPHSPHTPPERILKNYRGKGLPDSVAKYYAMCEWFDETCGQIVDMIEAKKLRDNTLIVYVCDNGWIQDPQSRRYAPRSKQTAYEGGVRTPIFFSWPSKYQPADRQELCSSIDIFPTIVAAAGARMPTDLPGLDLNKSLAEGHAIKREAIYGEAFGHDILDINNPEETLLFRWCIQGKWKLLLTYDGRVTKRYESTHPRTEKRPQLFDLLADPHENINLARDNPEVVAKLVEKINQWYPVRKRKTITEFD